MDRSRQTLSASDEVRLIRSEIRSAGTLDAVRGAFDRLQEIRREHVDDFELQISLADAQQEVIERARVLRGQPTAAASPVTVSDVRPAPEPEPEEAEIPAEVPKLDRKSWQLAVGLAVLLTVGICAAFFYLIQTARRLNFTHEQQAPAAAAPQAGLNPAKITPAAVVTPPTPSAPALRLYTDLAGGAATIDDQPAKDLVDGELNLDTITPGAHSLKVEGRSGSAAFTFVLDNETEAPRVTEITKVNNAMLVLVSVKDGQGRLTGDSAGASVALDGKPAGVIAPDGLPLGDLGNKDHDLDISRGKDNHKFVLTYIAAPTLTVFIKSDPSTGVVTVSTGLDGVFVFINNLPYRRPTVHGEVRIPLKVGTYSIRVHKDGLPDPPAATVEVKKSAEASVQFRLQAPPEFATLQIKGALPATSVSVDHQLAATVGVDGSAKVVNIRPGEHMIELHHEQAITKQLTRTFELGQSVTLSGSDVMLDRLAADNKSVIPGSPGGAVVPPPEVPHLESPTSAGAATEQVHHGGGFVPYRSAKAAGNYYFQAHARLGGVWKRSKLQWYAGYQDPANYVLFSLDGKHADVKEVRDGKQYDVGRVSLPVASDEWVQIEVSVKSDTLQARAKTGPGAWTNLAPVETPGRDFTKNGLGLYIPQNDDVSVANFRFSDR